MTSADSLHESFPVENEDDPIASLDPWRILLATLIVLAVAGAFVWMAITLPG